MCLQILGYFCCYCCLKNCRPRCIEICALISNIIEIAVLVWAIIEIPWKDIKILGKICFFLMCVFIVLNFIFLLILMCIRCSSKINTKKNGTGKCLCINMIVFDILSFILYLIGGVIILINMYNKEDEDDDYDNFGIYRGKNENKYPNRKWIAIGVSFSITELVLIFHCMCSILLYKIIKAKTNKSYSDYLEQKKSEVITTANVYSIPQTGINVNQLNFIGYDKDGHPIYSGNTQYQMASNQNITNIPINAENNNVNLFPQGN